MRKPPQQAEPTSESQAPRGLSPWVLGALAFFTTSLILTSREPLLSALTVLPLWALGLAGHHYRAQLHVVVAYFREYHAYLRAVDLGLAPPAGAVEPQARDSVELTSGEQAEFQRLMNEAGLRD